MSALYCEDNMLAAFPPPSPPPSKERGAPWRPPDTSRDVCARCGRVTWQHRSHPPILADEIDRAIYAAAFVAEMRERREEPPMDVAQDAVVNAEHMVELHRRARSGT